MKITIPNTNREFHIYGPWQRRNVENRQQLAAANAGPGTGAAPALPAGAAIPQPRRIFGFAIGPALPRTNQQANPTPALPAPAVTAPTLVTQATQASLPPPPAMMNAASQTPLPPSTANTSSQTSAPATTSTSSQTVGPVMVNASTQTQAHVNRMVPDAVMTRIMDHVIDYHDQDHRFTPGAARRSVANMMEIDRRSHVLLREQADTVRLTYLTSRSYGSPNRVNTAARVQTLLNGSPETFGHVTRLHPEHQERPLANLLNRLDGMQDVERHAATPLILTAIAALPPQNAANVLTQVVPHVTNAVLNTIVGAPNIPGTILNLPPTLQPQPLDAIVTRMWTNCMPGAPERLNIANIVNALPAGVGDLVKARVRNP